MDTDNMKEFIMDFSLDNCARGNQGYSRVLLQLFGYAGHGKSSFINSCKYIMDDSEYREYAKVADSSDAPETMMRTSYKLTENVTLVDNRGGGKMNKMETGEIYLQLGNFLPLDESVTWQTGFDDMMKKISASEMQCCAADFIVPVFVYCASSRISLTEEKEMISSARTITGVDPTVVLTHELCVPIHQLTNIRDTFRKMGARNIYLVENYTHEDNLKTRGKHTAILQCLYESLKDVEFKMKEELNPSEERIKRKEFLMTFAHKRALENQKQQIEEMQLKERLEREKEKEKEQEKEQEKAKRRWYYLWLH